MDNSIKNFTISSSSESIIEGINMELENTSDENREIEVEVKRVPEKRVYEEDGFTTVVKSKKFLRSSSKISNTNIQTTKEVYQISIVSKEILPKQIKMAKFLRGENFQNILRIKYKNPYKVIIDLENKEIADKIVNSSKLK